MSLHRLLTFFSSGCHHACLPFLRWMPLVTKKTLLADLMAGVTGAIIVLPQGIAFATIAGLPPEYGLYTAIITPIVAALFGSSYHLISGPTTAISLVIFSTVGGIVGHSDPARFIQVTLILTFLAGIYQLAFGMARLGKVVDFVSHTVVIGFTAGAALLIVTSQMKSLLGIKIEGSEFLETWEALFRHISETNISALIIGLSSLFVALAVKRWMKKLPNLLIALVVGSVIAWLISGDQHGVKFVPEIPSHLPPFSIPDISLASMKQLAGSAFAIALLGLIEAISISRSIASQSHQKIDANQEFIGQGLSNIIGSFFSSYAGSGSFTRSGVNYSSGAQTPLSAIFAAIILTLIVLLIAPWAHFLPIPAMAGVIMLVGYNLINFSQIQKIITHSRTETAILAVTFFSTLFLELEFAIYFGILISLVLFLLKTSHPSIVEMFPNYDTERQKRVLLGTCKLQHDQIHHLECPQLTILRIDMSVYFGSANHIAEYIGNLYHRKHHKHILILCPSVNFIDMTGVEMFEEQHHMLSSVGGGLYFADIKTEVLTSMRQFGLVEELGESHFFHSKKEAITTLSSSLLDQEVCKNCTHRVFTECGNTSTEDYALSRLTLETRVEKAKTHHKTKG